MGRRTTKGGTFTFRWNTSNFFVFPEYDCNNNLCRYARRSDSHETTTHVVLDVHSWSFSRFSRQKKRRFEKCGHYFLYPLNASLFLFVSIAPVVKFSPTFLVDIIINIFIRKFVFARSHRSNEFFFFLAVPNNILPSSMRACTASPF